MFCCRSYEYVLKQLFTPIWLLFLSKCMESVVEQTGREEVVDIWQ